MKYSMLNDPSNMWPHKKLLKMGEGTVIDGDVRIVGPDMIIIGSNCYIAFGTYIRGKVSIGDDVWIGPYCQLNGEGVLLIQNNVGIGNGVIILTTLHKPLHGSVIVDRPLKKKIVVLMAGCDIGVGALIGPGVTVGCGAQVGMGAVVLSDVPEDTYVPAGTRWKYGSI